MGLKREEGVITSGNFDYIYIPSIDYERMTDKFGEFKRLDLLVIGDKLIIHPNPKGTHSIDVRGKHTLSAKISCKRCNTFFRFEEKKKYKLFEASDHYFIREGYFL